MRPIHAVLLLSLLAAVLAGALLLVRSDTRSGRIAGPVSETPSGPERRPAAPDLSQVPGAPADGIAPGTERAQVHSGGDAHIVQGPIGLRGRVVDPEGRPVAGATVYAASSDLPPGLGLDDLDGAFPFLKRQETTTDRDGRFTLQPESQGAVRIAVRADGFAPFNAQKPVAGTSLDVGDLRLERGVVLLGRVLDSNGAPVPGAELHDGSRTRSAGILALPGSRGPLLGVTDAGGNFRIDRLAVGPWTLVVTSEEHPDRTQTGETDQTGQVVPNLVITLEPGFDIDGRVVSGPTEGFADLVVVATERALGDGLFDAFAPQRRATIDSAGTFKLRGCQHDAEYRLGLRTRSREFLSGLRSEPVTAKSGDRNIVLTYRPGTSLTCRVVDRSTGKPLEDLHVSAGFRWPIPLMEEGGAPKRHFPQGLVRYPALRLGQASDPATLRIECVGHVAYERSDLRLEPGRENDLGTIELDRSAVVHVTVVEEGSGAPIANAHVTLNELQPNGGAIGMTFSIDTDGGGEPDIGGEGAAQRGRTGKDGRVDVSSLPGKRAVLSVRQSDHATWKSEPLDLPADGDFDVLVRMTGGGTLVVEVLDRDGKPVPGLTIDHRGDGARPEAFVPGSRSAPVTDGAGRVVFAHVAAGRHFFRVRPPGSDPLVSLVLEPGTAAGGPGEGWQEAVAVEGETITVRLPAPDLGDLAGRVREGGKPLAGATVRLRARSEGSFFGLESVDLDLGTRPLSTTTNAAGEYTFTGVPAEEYRVLVSHPSRAMQWEGKVGIEEGRTRFDIELPLATIEGRVTNEEGKPVEGARVSVQRAQETGDGEGAKVSMSFVMVSNEGDESFQIGSGTNEPVSRTDADGRYRLRGVTPDVPLQVVVSGREYQTSRSNELRLTTDETHAGVDIVVKQGGAIEVTARRADGSAVAGAIVRAERAEGEGDPKTGFTGPDGRATLTGLAPGRWRITCTRTAFEEGARDSRGTPREVVVRPGATERVTLDLSP